MTGFHTEASQFSFVERRNVVLSIDTDNTSEECLMKAVTQAKLNHLQGLLLTEYMSYADTSSVPAHYVLFWDLKPPHDNESPPMLDENMLEDCCSELEVCLDYVYRR